MPAVALSEKKEWTYQDYLTIDDDRRYEIYGGELLMSPVPNLVHQRISRDLEFLLWQHIDSKTTNLMPNEI